jgi:hypothetical protein
MMHLKDRMIAAVHFVYVLNVKILIRNYTFISS